MTISGATRLQRRVSRPRNARQRRPSWTILLGACLAVLAPAASWSAEPVFTNSFARTESAGPMNVVAGDFVRDGRLDLAVTNFFDNSVSILIGFGNGKFQDIAKVPVGANPIGIVTGDWNGDGRPDLAVANFSGDTVSILLGQEQGQFTQAHKIPVGAAPSQLAVGDWNGDGILDLAVSNRNSSSISILKGAGDGSFTLIATLATLPGNRFPAEIVAGDWNGDGKPDLAVVNHFDPSPGPSTEPSDVSIYLGNGDGTFTPFGAVPVGSFPGAIATGDWNGDGKADLAVANARSDNLSILLGNGDGTFTPASPTSTVSSPAAIAVGDWNQDGWLDLAVTSRDSDRVEILRGNGDGTFTNVQSVAVGKPCNTSDPCNLPNGIAAGDWNRDGKLDLVVCVLGDKSINVLRNDSQVGADELLVGNLLDNSVTVYPRTADGNVAPVRTLLGNLTGLAGPIRLLVDTFHDELVVVSGGAGASLTAYPRTASGNALPVRRIAGGSTALAGPVDVVLDPIRDELVVVNAAASSVTAYARTATGDVAPVRTLQGAATGLGAPRALALDLVHDELLVADHGGSIAVFARTALGDVAPLRTLTGASTGLSGPMAVALDLVRDELWVVNGDNSSLTVYPRTAGGDTPPTRIIQGDLTGLVNPIDAVLDLVNDEVVVLNGASNTITVYSRTASGNIAPSRQVAGGATALHGPPGIFATTSPPMVGAVLPGSRSVRTTAQATVFASMINAGPGPAQMCFPVPITPVPAVYSFQTTNALNQLVGTPNTPANIPAGGTQSFLLVFTPTAPFEATVVDVGFACDGVSRATLVSGVTAVLLAASVTPVADVIALAATEGNTGVLTLPDPMGSAAFAVATANVGAAATITVSADTGGATLPVTLFVCQTEPATGACLEPPDASVTLTIGAGQTPTFAIFAIGSGAIAFNPGANRVFVWFYEGSAARGSTSVAIRAP